ncbi:MAG: hypothetical protein WCW35_12590 [Bacteroidota bacterium]
MEVLFISAFSIGLLHALAPDHWLPFVVLGKSQEWSRWKTTRIVSLAGLGHVGSSVVIVLIGLTIGTAMEQVNGWEEVRGTAASVLMVLFGGIYTVWGIMRWRNHTHDHTYRHVHPHGLRKEEIVSYWTLFALIVFGPCEPLIPLIFAAIPYGWIVISAVFILFGTVTVLMMLLQVHLAMLGLSWMKFHFLNDASHITAGVVIILTGLAIMIFGM